MVIFPLRNLPDRFSLSQTARFAAVQPVAAMSTSQTMQSLSPNFHFFLVHDHISYSRKAEE